jgi:ABC-2 type transport system ATP-binding protein
MQIQLQNLGKRYNREWIFRGMDLEMETGQNYTFIGPNGSGKSTLLQVVAGAMPATEGKMIYQEKDKKIEEEAWFKHIAIAAPYLELIEEFTPTELLQFHQKFKPFKNGISTESILENTALMASQDKPIKYFSSGMKQRLKLALAFASDVSIVLLDEPTANLDATWTAWYKTQVTQPMPSQLLMIYSNLPYEYDFCSNIVNLNTYKP